MAVFDLWNDNVSAQKPFDPNPDANKSPAPPPIQTVTPPATSSTPSTAGAGTSGAGAGPAAPGGPSVGNLGPASTPGGASPADLVARATTPVTPQPSSTTQQPTSSVSSIARDAGATIVPTKTGPSAGYTQPVDPNAKTGPSVVRERGTYSTDKDPLTGVVKDADANNHPATATAKTWVADDGSVHYTGSNPDGSPKPPTADKAGWKLLTEDQRTAALTDYLQELKDFKDAHSSGIPDGLDEETLSTMDTDGQIATLENALKKPDEEPSTPKVVVAANGVDVTYTERDADGKLIPPWQQEGYDDLTPEQKQVLKTHFAQALRAEGQKQTDAAAAGVADTGLTQEQLDALPPDEYADLIEHGIKPPVHNADMSVTYTAADGTVTTKKDGKVTFEKKPDGTQTTYGADGTSYTSETLDGLVTTVDNQGNKKITRKIGSVAEADASNLRAIGIDPDTNERMSSFELWATKRNASNKLEPGDFGYIDPKNPDPRRLADFKDATAKFNVSSRSAGEPYARVAVALGLLKKEDYDAMEHAPPGRSFGAWMAANFDLCLGIDLSNITIPETRGSVESQLEGPAFYEDSDEYFASIRSYQRVDPAGFQSLDLSHLDTTVAFKPYDPFAPGQDLYR